MKNTEVKKFVEYVTTHKLIKKNDKILVGVSGGVDSMTLLYLLHEVREIFKIEIGAAHVNYSLRGDDSDKDQKVVEKFCKQNDIPCFVYKLKLKSQLKNDSLQVKAREVRYEFYDKICSENGFNKIAVAHNANDNAETVLLNLFRGSGIEGLRGIPVRRENIIRPLIFMKREEILDYAKENKIKFRHDKSNFKDIYKRNFIRLKLFPLIEKRINASAIDNINQFSQIFTEFSEFTDEYVKNAVKYVRKENSSSEFSLDIKKLNSYINFIRKKVIISCYYGFSKEILSSDKIIKILDIISSQPGKKLVLNKNIVLWKERDSIVFKRVNDSKKPDSSKFFSKNDEIDLGFGILSGSESRAFKLISNPDTEYIDLEKVKGKLLVRKWRQGDYFYPIGLNGKKKISDFLTDAKVPSHEKESVLVLENSGKIVWVIGFRLDDRFKCNDKSKNILKIELKRK